MIDFESFTKATLSPSPFHWAHLEKVFFPEDAAGLVRDFPAEGFTQSNSPQGHYSLWDRTLVDQSRRVGSTSGLPASWSETVAAFLSPRYREAVETLAATSLARCELKVRLCKYPPGGWMLPHTDRPDRVVTQIVYLSPKWEAKWGGCLRLLNSEDADDVATEVVPRFNTSVIFVRSERSFHAVTPVSEGTKVVRLSILSQFVRAED